MAPGDAPVNLRQGRRASARNPLRPVRFGGAECFVPADSEIITVIALDALLRLCGLRRCLAYPGPDSWPDALVLRAYALGRDGRWWPTRNSVNLPIQLAADLEELVAGFRRLADAEVRHLAERRSLAQPGTALHSSNHHLCQSARQTCDSPATSLSGTVNATPSSLS
jgi:hypothetical protein